MQEQMTRLIKDNKIVGYLKITSTGGIFHDRICEPDGGMNWLKDYPIRIGDYDAIEPGRKVDGEWWFAGDRGDVEDGGLFTLVYAQYAHSWGILFDGGSGSRSGLYDEPTSANYWLRYAKHIGNIHEEK